MQHNQLIKNQFDLRGDWKIQIYNINKKYISFILVTIAARLNVADFRRFVLFPIDAICRIKVNQIDILFIESRSIFLIYSPAFTEARTKATSYAKPT